MAPEPEALALRRLRWPVALVTRQQLPQIDGPGIDELLLTCAVVRADIQPVGALQFWDTAGGMEQVDSPFTHRIFLRWTGTIDQTGAVLRSARCPDQTIRTEVFRVRRMKELGGRKRFVCLEVDLEKQS